MKLCMDHFTQIWLHCDNSFPPVVVHITQMTTQNNDDYQHNGDY